MPGQARIRVSSGPETLNALVTPSLPSISSLAHKYVYFYWSFSLVLEIFGVPSDTTGRRSRAPFLPRCVADTPLEDVLTQSQCIYASNHSYIPR